METEFIPAALTDIAETLTQHLTTLPSPVDTFFESHVEDARHFHIFIDNIEAGYTSIHAGTLVTQFYLADPFKKFGQNVFQQIKKLETVQKAFVPTCDEFFLSHALDEYRLLEKQAYFFQPIQEDVDQKELEGFSFRAAETGDIELIRQASQDFFDSVAQHVERGELFITSRDDTFVGIGVMIRSKFRPNVADIGMYTIEEFRNMGVGTATITFLRKKCRRDGQQVVAGCWYYNHLSKRTLEKAGMYSQTRLLKISY